MSKAKVYRTETVVGHGWRWTHSCRWKGGAETTSYPLKSWSVAYGEALRHLGECL